jgi:hypothetical protein
LRASGSSFSGKLFLRRECFWAATEVFAGTDYDCNDWAVALNTARFYQVKSIPGGYQRSDGPPFDGGEAQNREIRARIDASIWPTEQLRRSIRKRVRRYFCQVVDLSREFVARFSRRPAEVERGPAVDCYVPPPWVRDLIGFSPGEMIALLGCYRRSLVGKPQEIRSVYLDRTTGILVLRDDGGGSAEASPYQSWAHDCGERRGIVVVDAGLEMERRAEKLAKGSESLLGKVPELARACLGDHLRISVSSDSPGRSGEIESFEQDADLVILPRLLNVFPRPLTALRRSVNSLIWGGSLVAGCVAVPRRQLEIDWQKSAWLSHPGFQILYSDDAVFRLLEVAGLKVTWCIRLNDEEVVSFSVDSERAAGELASFGRLLFQASGYNRTFGTLLFLVCKKSF